MINDSYANSLKPMKIWLTSLVALVILMIAVGGITRLTRSGLSIVEWRPMAGIVPPLTEADWMEQFELYKKTPEFKLINTTFNLQNYKNIFLWEYIHRVLGRLIFFMALIPGLFFWRKKLFSGRQIALICSLIAAQGLIGWLMVKSGLSREPHVSPFMLALHFFSALSVLVVIYYYLAKLQKPLIVNSDSNLIKSLFRIFGGTLAIQIFYGCLTSGWKAGFAFNTYPLMGGEFFPPGGFIQKPTWINFFTNPASVQWVHRWCGIVVLGIISSLFIIINKSKNQSELWKPFLFLLSLIFVQVMLGVLNIIFIVPIPLAVIHQVVASIIVLGFYNIVFRLEDRVINT